MAAALYWTVEVFLEPVDEWMNACRDGNEGVVEDWRNGEIKTLDESIGGGL